ncbi:hypothetical protein D3C71_663920 [compost metagenome]
MTATVPDVEVTDYRYSFGIWRPYGEAHTVDAVHGHQLCTEGAAQIPVIALGEQVQIHVAEQWTEAVGIFGGLFATGPAGPQQIRLRPVEVPDEQPRCLGRLKVAELFPGFLGHHLHAQGVRQIGPNELPAGTVAVGAENCKRVVMLGTHQCVDIARPG